MEVEFNPNFNFKVENQQSIQQIWDFSKASQSQKVKGQKGLTNRLDKIFNQRLNNKEEINDQVDDTIEDIYLQNQKKRKKGIDEPQQLKMQPNQDNLLPNPKASTNKKFRDTTSNKQTDTIKQVRNNIVVDQTEDTQIQQSKQKDTLEKPFYDQSNYQNKQQLTFQELNLSKPLIRACNTLGYDTPTPIQAGCIPLALTGRDIVGSAITGSGKTAAYALPILERLLHRDKRAQSTYVLIVVPTRELAVQVHQMTGQIAQYTDIRSALIVGGLSMQAQATQLRSSPEIIVATPGRLIDHVRNTQDVSIEGISILILDEADRLLGMGFKEELTEIIKLAPRSRQTLLFSATMTEEVKNLIKLSLQKPIRLAADPAFSTPKNLTQQIIRLKGKEEFNKEAVMIYLCKKSFNKSGVIIFFDQKVVCHRAAVMFGILKVGKIAELHGNMSQVQRLQSLDQFRKGEVQYLLATDVAARGLDVVGVNTVLNYDAPKQTEQYLHRIGRTARAGNRGLAVSLICDKDKLLVKSIIKKLKVRLEERKVNQEAVFQLRAQIDQLQEDIKQVLKDDRIEKELEQAEIQATKAQNLIDHDKEIKARPAKTWFLSGKQKDSIKQKTKEVYGKGKGELDEGELYEEQDRGQSKEDKKQSVKDIKSGKQSNSRDPKSGKQQNYKPSLQNKKDKQGIQNNNKHTSSKFKHKSKTQESKLKHNDSDNGPSKVYSGGARSSNLKLKPGVSKLQQNKFKRQGKGRNTFKSKKKFKRR